MQSALEAVVHPGTAVLVKYEEGMSLCFIGHSANEELEEMKRLV